MNSLLKLSVIILGPTLLTACVQKDYVVMQGATPEMPKEQALAWCEDKVDRGANIAIEKARLSGALSDAMQPKSYSVIGYTNCNSIGSFTNCNSTGYANPMPSYNSGEVGQAMGAALGSALARPGKVKKCMAMMGYSEIEVQETSTNQSNITSKSASQSGRLKSTKSPIGKTISNDLDSYAGWSIGKLDGVNGFTGCYAMNNNSVKLGLPMSIMIEKGRYDNAILSVRHDGKAVPKSKVGNITLGELQLNNLPVASLTGKEAFAPLRLTSEVRNALQSLGLISWDVNDNYAYVLSEAPELINRLEKCADADNFQAYKRWLGAQSSSSSSNQPVIDFVSGQDGLTNEQRYNLARQILDYKDANKAETSSFKSSQSAVVKPNRPAVKLESRITDGQLYPTTLFGEWVLESSNCTKYYEPFKIKRIRVDSAPNDEWHYYFAVHKQGEFADERIGGLKVVDGNIVQVNFLWMIMEDSIKLTDSNSRISAKQLGGRCEVTLVRN